MPTGTKTNVHNHKIVTRHFTTLHKRKTWEPAYSKALNQSKIDRRGQYPENQAGRYDSQTGIRWMVFRVQTGREVGEEGDESRYELLKSWPNVFSFE